MLGGDPLRRAPRRSVRSDSRPPDVPMIVDEHRRAPWRPRVRGVVPLRDVVSGSRRRPLRASKARGRRAREQRADVDECVRMRCRSASSRPARGRMSQNYRSRPDEPRPGTAILARRVKLVVANDRNQDKEARSMGANAVTPPAVRRSQPCTARTHDAVAA
jgi:hypothetical protein